MNFNELSQLLRSHFTVRNFELLQPKCLRQSLPATTSIKTEPAMLVQHLEEQERTWGVK